MSRSLSFSAPGKLVLLGEYAVLAGAPALVMAVDRRARAAVRPSPDGHWRVEAPGFLDSPAAFSLSPDGGVRWETPGAADRLGLVTGLFPGLAREGLLAPADLSPSVLALDTRAFFAGDLPGRPKLGLGSSAALTTAAAAALLALGPGGPAPEAAPLLGPLVRIHRDLQGGRGSGIDVAASLYGGVLRYRAPSGGAAPEVSPFRLPAGLHLGFVWTGRAASTGDFLALLESSLARDAGPVQGCMDELGELSARGLQRLSQGGVPSFLETVEAFCDALERLGDLLGAPVLSPAHRTLRTLAARAGAAYKPSGAGGGDFGVAFAPERSSLQRFAGLAREAGFLPMEFEPDPLGALPGSAKNPGV